MTQLNLTDIRAQFPALALTDDGQPRIYLDNPAGTQVPRHVVDRMTRYLIESNANHGGFFRTSQASDMVLDQAHQGMADLLNAASAEEIIFGPNMTTLTFHLSRSLARRWQPGDEIVLTRMDHDANVSPWALAAADREVTVRWLDFDVETFRYRLDMLPDLLNGKTRLVAVNYASNALGTINDVAAVCAAAKAVGAVSYVDAVQYVPHGPTDVQAIGCDFLACSAYKFFGPHQGVVWGRSELLHDLFAYKVRPAEDIPPGKFETGTQVHEGQAGTLGALEYLTWLGETQGQPYWEQYAQFERPRQLLHAAMAAIKQHEQAISRQLIEGLQAIPGVEVYGITALDGLDDRVPTVVFRHARHHPDAVARHLAQHNIFVWSGHYYALEVVSRLGLADSGGMVRVGAAHYNTPEEINRFLEVVAGM